MAGRLRPAAKGALSKPKLRFWAKRLHKIRRSPLYEITSSFGKKPFHQRQRF